MPMHETRPGTAPIFVVGLARSGTTLLAKILNQHAHICMPKETAFINKVFGKRSELGEPSADLAARQNIITALSEIYPADHPAYDLVVQLMSDTDLKERLLQATSYADAYDIFMGSQASAAGKRRWGNNEHGDIFHIDTIMELFPDARIIITMRHPLDYLVSYRDKWRHDARLGDEQRTKRLRSLYHPVTTSLLWLGTAKAAASALKRWPESTILCRYEDLVSRPEEQIKRVCDLIDEPYTPDLLGVSFNNSSKSGSSKGIFSTSVGRWRELLPPADAFVSQMLCAKRLRTFGYQKERIQFSPVGVARHMASGPRHIAKSIAERRGERGPMLRFVLRRVAALVHQ